MDFSGSVLTLETTPGLLGLAQAILKDTKKPLIRTIKMDAISRNRHVLGTELVQCWTSNPEVVSSSPNLVLIFFVTKNPLYFCSK